MHFQELESEFEALGFAKEWHAALALHKAWRKEYPANFWGTTISREERFPRDETDEALLTNELGVAKFTMRLDWKTSITADDCSRIKEKFPYMDVSPGIWLHDYKTASRRESNLMQVYSNSPQGFVYPAVYNILHNEPCMGMIYHRVINTKTAGFQHAAIPATGRGLEMTRSFLRNGELLLNTDMTLGVASGCQHYFRSCEFLGECDQIGGMK